MTGVCDAGMLRVMRPGYCRVEIRASGISRDGDRFWEQGGHRFVADQDDLVFRSPLETGDVNTHLKWMFECMGHDRKAVRRLQDAGMRMVVRIFCSNLPVSIEPESLLLMHLLHLPLEIVKSPRRLKPSSPPAGRARKERQRFTVDDTPAG